MERNEDIAAMTSDQRRRLLEHTLRKRLSSDHKTLPLSAGQQALWYRYSLDPTDYNYHVVFAARVFGAIDAREFKRAFDRIVERHGSLRMMLLDDEGSPRQTFVSGLPAHFVHRTLTTSDDAEVRKQIRGFVREPFELRNADVHRAALFSLSQKQHIIAFVAHHIAVDYWSLLIIVDELTKAYGNDIDTNPDLVPLLTDYGSFVNWQESFARSTDGSRQLMYWEQQLKDINCRVELPTAVGTNMSGYDSRAGQTCVTEVPAHVIATIKQLAARSDATLFTVLFAAYATLLHAFTGEKSIAIGCPMSGRTRPEWQSVVGDFVNPVTLCVTFCGDLSFEAVLEASRSALLTGLGNQELPFSAIVKALDPDSRQHDSPFYNAGFVFQKSQLSPQFMRLFIPDDSGSVVRCNQLDLLPYVIPQQEAQLDLTLEMAELNGTVHGAFKFRSSRFDLPTIRRMSSHYQNILARIAANPTIRLSDLTETAGESHQPEIHGEVAVAVEPEQRVDFAIADQARHHPNRAAIMSSDGSLTFSQLEEKANAITDELRRQGVKPGMLVGICAARHPNTVAAILGVLKTGAAYVPFDGEYPQSRLQFMIGDAKPAALIVDDQQTSVVDMGDSMILRLSPTGEISVARRPTSNQPTLVNGLAYVMYTSGSTGNPKGVAVSHVAVQNTLRWLQAAYALRENDVVAQKTSLSFTDSVWEFLWPLQVGASVSIIEHERVTNPVSLYDRLRHFGVTVTQFIPVQMSHFLNGMTGIEQPSLPKLRRVFNGGEALPTRLARQWYTSFPDATISNIYGMTESAIYATEFVARVESLDDRHTHVLIGKPISNADVLILNQYGKQCYEGVTGEIHIGGVGIANGYLNRPDLTASRFIPHPYSKQAGSRLYKTGDLGRVLSDGNIEFLGRIDNQVKVRGCRVELGEVESVIREHADVDDAIVVAADENDHDVYLAAFVVTSGKAEINIGEVRSFVAERVPSYMIPGTFSIIDAIPVTPTGKPDRRSLRAPKRSRETVQQEYTPPRNDTERALADVWRDVLGVEQVGIHDNFFELGGHSLQVSQILSRVRTSLHRNVAFASFFDNATIAALAEHVAALAKDEESARALGVTRVPRGRKKLETLLEDL